MAKVLTIPASNELTQLIEKKLERINVTALDEEAINHDGVEYLKLVPFISVYAFDRDEGKLKILHYRQPDTVTMDEDDADVPGVLSLVFSGDIDVESGNGVYCSDHDTDEDGNTEYVMSLEDILNTAILYGDLGFEKMTGTTLGLSSTSKLGWKLDTDTLTPEEKSAATKLFDKQDLIERSGFISDGSNPDVLGIGIHIEVTPSELASLLESIEANPEYISEIELLVINVDTLILRGDITEDLRNLCDNIKQSAGITNASGIILDFLIKESIHSITSNLKYSDLVLAANFNKDHARGNALLNADLSEGESSTSDIQVDGGHASE